MVMGVNDRGSIRRWFIIVPSVLSVGRLVLAAWFVWASPAVAVWLIVAAAASDFIDGYLARRFNLTSWIGGLLDAIADKAFALTVLVTFAWRQELAWWQVALLLSRDAVVASIAAYAAATAQWHAFKKMPSRPFGKVTTAVLFLFFLVIALWPTMQPLILTLWALAVILSALAAGDYARQFWCALVESREPRRHEGHEGRQ